MKSTAAVAHSLRTPFVVEDVELPALPYTDVLVRIALVARGVDFIVDAVGAAALTGIALGGLAQGRFPFDKLVRFYPFDEINRAVEDQRNGIAIKPILELTNA